MTSKVTQCPECKTSFRVTEAQLTIASGAVRCGSCLHIFNAQEHWQEQPAPQKEEPELDSLLEQHASELDEIFSDQAEDPLMGDTIQQKSIRNIFEEDDDLEIDDSFGIDDDDLKIDDSFGIEDDDLEIDDNFGIDDDLEINPEAAPETALSEEQQTRIEEDLLAELDEEDEVLFNDTVQQKAISLIERDDDESLLDELDDYDTSADNAADDDKELIFDDRDSDDRESIKDTRTGLIIDSGMISADDLKLEDSEDTQELSDSFLDIESWDDEASIFNDQDNLEENSSGDKDDWAEKLLAEEDEDQEEEQDELDLDDIVEEAPAEPPRAQPLDPELLDILDDQPPPSREDEFILGEEPMLAGERIGLESNPLLANIEPEPVEMSWQQKTDRKQKIFWLVAIVVALTGLAGQYLAFNFETLARDPQSRPAMTSLCALAGCDIPDLDDVSLVRSTNLMVRSSTERNNTLVVDVIITNRARFDQAFPTMELVFTDLDGNVVAGRQFLPAQYLAGEMTGSTRMPSMQPVHISLEIVDPGEQAVNYQLNLLRNPGS